MQKGNSKGVDKKFEEQRGRKTRKKKKLMKNKDEIFEKV